MRLEGNNMRVDMKKIYLTLAIIGTGFPYYYLTQFILENGFNIALLGHQLFANYISTFFAVDFFISCTVFLIFMFCEVKRYSIKTVQWICFATLFTVGLSLALPLFLIFREDYISTQKQQ